MTLFRRRSAEPIAVGMGVKERSVAGNGAAGAVQDARSVNALNLRV